MKIKNNFELRNICGEEVLIPVGTESVNLNCIIHLNESGAFLWREAEKGAFDNESLVRALLEEYEVEKSVAKNDVQAFVDKLVEFKIVTD